MAALAHENLTRSTANYAGPALGEGGEGRPPRAPDSKEPHPMYMYSIRIRLAEFQSTFFLRVSTAETLASRPSAFRRAVPTSAPKPGGRKPPARRPIADGALRPTPTTRRQGKPEAIGEGGWAHHACVLPADLMHAARYAKQVSYSSDIYSLPIKLTISLLTPMTNLF